MPLSAPPFDVSTHDEKLCSAPRPTNPPGRAFWALAAAILTLAAALRLWDLGWGLPAIEEEALPMKKAFEMWGWPSGHLTLDPNTAGWPSLSFYAHLLLQHLQLAVDILRGEARNGLDFFVAYRLDPTETVLWARSLGVIASLGVVAVALRMGRDRLPGYWGLLPAAILASSPLFVAQSQMVTPDILLTLFAALAVERIARVGDEGRTRDYVLAGVFAGLGTAAKYTPVLLCLSLFLVHLRRLRREQRSLRALGLDDARLGWAALATILAFCLASPYTFADLSVLRRDIAYQMLHMQRGHFGHTAQGPGYLYYLTGVLAPGLGWPTLLAGIGGLGLAAWRRRGWWLDLLLCALPLAVVLGSLSTRFDRYMLPLLLPLAFGATGFLVLAAEAAWVRRQRRGVRGAGLALLVGLLLGPLATGAYHHHRTVDQPSTQRAAARWLEAHADPDTTTFVTEHYGPHVLDDERAELQESPVFARLDEEQRRRLLERPFFQYQLLPLYSTRVELGAFYYDLRFLLAHDFVITSGAVRKRYEAAPESFPRRAAFYRDLDDYCQLAAAFSPSRDTRGPEIRIYRVTENTRRRLLTDRGALEAGFARPWYQKVHRPHFLGFLEAVGAHALIKHRYRHAALFFGELLDVVGPEQRGYVLERVAYSRLRGGDLDGAEASYQQLRLDPAYRAVALANLGFVREQRGDLEAARTLYRQSLDAEGNDAIRQWIQARLSRMQ